MNPWLWWLGQIVIGRHHRVGLRFALSQSQPRLFQRRLGYDCVCVCVCVANTPWKRLCCCVKLRSLLLPPFASWEIFVCYWMLACVDSGHIHTLRHVHTPSHMYTYTHTHTHSYSHTYAAGYVKKEKPVLQQRCVIICVAAQFETLVNHSTRV